ncbi:HalOD1 output domain-containing protein [Haladaptatus sp. DYF46]|uniref:HalOD1 output domain-containing protein n=1 Tax=Haladaptatus sp. DYF46 TaxID=2886041 RepID=UPI001E313605|nr:HalOD1 output domain-containing protein [Haladaptatus sp. DYF46]
MTGRTPPSDDEDEQRETIIYQTEFDPTADTVSEAVIRVIATLINAGPTELVPLSEVIDLEALDALFGPKDSGIPRNTNGHVLFNYEAYHVRVDSSGQITVQQPDPEIDD